MFNDPKSTILQKDNLICSKIYTFIAGKCYKHNDGMGMR